jgi:assimilatory nitrate reductase catalytic subunit
MGGREVGGMANQLAAHLSLEDPAHRDWVQRFWGAPRIAPRPGLRAVELFQAIGEGRIQAVWIMGTNPVVSLPEADRVRAALARCPLVVVSDCMRHTDTTALAQVRLPALAWGEKDGTVTNSERRISRQRAFLPAPGEARPDWWMVSQVAQRMGFGEAFRYTGAAAIFREHAALSGVENHGRRDFDISGLVQADYDRLGPVQWPVTPNAPYGTARLFGEGRFFTPSGKAQLIPVVPRLPEAQPANGQALVFNTGRIRDQWHTMTRTGSVARLMAHLGEPYAELHPDDARWRGIEDGGLVRLRSSLGELMVRARLSADQRPGSVFVPMHWTDQFTAQARVDTLVPAVLDPLSGQPESKHARVTAEPYRAAWYGFVLLRRDLDPPASPLFSREARGKGDRDPGLYWARIPGPNCWRWELAGTERPDDWVAWAHYWVPAAEAAGGEETQWLEYLDAAGGRYRAARLRGRRLDACLFISPEPALPERAWLESLFGPHPLTPAERAGLLAGRPPAGQYEAGMVVCACYQVGREAIRQAIRREGLTTVAALGHALQAGTQCGSCIPELQRLIAETRVQVQGNDPPLRKNSVQN